MTARSLWILIVVVGCKGSDGGGTAMWCGKRMCDAVQENCEHGLEHAIDNMTPSGKCERTSPVHCFELTGGGTGRMCSPTAATCEELRSRAVEAGVKGVSVGACAKR